MDFLQDALATGRKVRTLSIEDAYTREMLAIEVDTSLPALRVVRVLEKLRLERGLPVRIVIDHGTEFTSKALDQWAYENKVTLHFITPGRPMENGYIESFHGKFREECLNEHWFLTLDDARETIESWRIDYNQVRPHSALGYLTPEEFATGHTVALVTGQVLVSQFGMVVLWPKSAVQGVACFRPDKNSSSTVRRCL